MANIETTAAASMVNPNMLAISVSRFCLRSLRFNALFITEPPAALTEHLQPKVQRLLLL